MSGRSLPTFLELLGPRDWRNGSALTVMLALALAVTTLIGDRDRARLRVRPALPRFSVCRPDHGGGAVFDPDAAQSPAAGRAPDRRSGVCRHCWRWRRSTRSSTKDRTTGSRCGPARSISCSPLRCGRRGPCKSQNKQADREARQPDIVEHDPESGGDQSAGQQDDRRPDDVKRCDDQRDDAEYRIRNR